jgi:hypothetical protein
MRRLGGVGVKGLRLDMEFYRHDWHCRRARADRKASHDARIPKARQPISAIPPAATNPAICRRVSVARKWYRLAAPSDAEIKALEEVDSAGWRGLVMSDR